MEELTKMYNEDKQILIKQVFQRLAIGDDEKINIEHLKHGLMVNNVTLFDLGKKTINQALIGALQKESKLSFGLSEFKDLIEQTFAENDSVMM